MLYHETTGNQTLRGLRILLLVALLPAAGASAAWAIYRYWLDATKGLRP